MTIPRKKLLERIIDQFVVIKTDIWDRKNDYQEALLLLLLLGFLVLSFFLSQMSVIKTDIWDRKNDKTKKEAAGENNRSISCH